MFGGYKPDTMTSSNSMYQISKLAPDKKELEEMVKPQLAKGIRFDQRVVVAGEDGGRREVSFNADKFHGAFKRVDDVDDKLLEAEKFEQVHEIAIRLFLQPTGWNASMEFPFKRSHIDMLCDRVEPIFRSESNCISVRAPVKIFGDIHGQFGDLMTFFREYGSPSPNAPGGDLNSYNYLFLGDYVDRGSHSLETIILLFSLKIQYPEQIFLLRGNHESEETNAAYGFLEECEERIGEEDGQHAWARINQVFCWLPPAAVVNNQLLAVHGGIGTHIGRVQDIHLAQRGTSCMDGGPVLLDLMWSDPAEHDSIAGTHESPRGVSAVFGPDRVNEFLTASNLNCIIRAHQCVQDGFEVFASGHLITLFSATNYCGVEGNSGAICYVAEDGNIQFKIIEPKDVLGSNPWLECNRPPTPKRERQFFS